MPWGRSRRICLRREGGQQGHASTSDIDRIDRGGCAALVGEQFHPHARNAEIDLECSRDHLCCIVAPERFWAFPFALSHPHWEVSEAG